MAAAWQRGRASCGAGAQPEALAIRAVPNRRVADAVAARAWIQGDGGPSTVGAWRSGRGQLEGIEPEEIWGLAGSLGYDAHITWSGPEAIDGIDVLMRRRIHETQPVWAGWQRLARADRGATARTAAPRRKRRTAGAAAA